MNQAEYAGVLSQLYKQRDGETAYPFFNRRLVTSDLLFELSPLFDSLSWKSSGAQATPCSSLAAPETVLEMDLPCKEGM